MHKNAIELTDPIERHVNRDFVRLRPELTVGEALLEIRRQRPASRIIYFYVLDAEGKLLGVVPTRRLLLEFEARLADVMIHPSDGRRSRDHEDSQIPLHGRRPRIDRRRGTRWSGAVAQRARRAVAGVCRRDVWGGRLAPSLGAVRARDDVCRGGRPARFCSWRPGDGRACIWQPRLPAAWERLPVVADARFGGTHRPTRRRSRFAACAALVARRARRSDAADNRSRPSSFERRRQRRARHGDRRDGLRPAEDGTIGRGHQTISAAAIDAALAGDEVRRFDR